MFDTLFGFFRDKIFNGNLIAGITIPNINLFGSALSFKNWLCITCTIITMIFIFVLCCLFVYKIIKLIGGLIR